MEDNSTRNFNNPGNNQGGSFSYGVNRPNQTPPQNNDDERLKKLHQQLNQSSGDGEKHKRRFRVVIWVILILLLVGLAVAGVILFVRGSGNLDLGTSIRLSVNVDERLEDTTTDDSISKKKIFPGHSFPVVVEVRNSNDFSGDSETLEVAPIFVRFKVELILENKTYNNVVVPTIQASNWCGGEELTNDTYTWDGYYYYYGRLISQESVPLFTAITFDFANTTNDMAGKSAEIKITVEAVEGDAINVGASEAWGSAPNQWLSYVQQNFGE